MKGKSGMIKITEWFLRWMCSWGQLLDGLIGVLTLGYGRTTFALNNARKLTRWRSKHEKENK
jgi:hypothetical protein